MPLGMHWPELLVMMLIAALLFGAKRLPELGASVGKAIRAYQKSMQEIAEPVREALVPSPVQPQQPLVSQARQAPAVAIDSGAQTGTSPQSPESNITPSPASAGAAHG